VRFRPDVCTLRGRHQTVRTNEAPFLGLYTRINDYSQTMIELILTRGLGVFFVYVYLNSQSPNTTIAINTEDALSLSTAEFILH
jgi:hypothetical protein